MPRLHIPFRFGEPSGYSAGKIREIANQVRKLTREGDASFDQSRTVSLDATLKALGGRMGLRSSTDTPLENQIAIEVWGERDFILHEPFETTAGNNRLNCFVLLGSYVLHYAQFVEEKWTAKDGSPIGMQWARAGGAPAEINGRALKEAQAFATSLLAPASEMRKAIEQHGPDHFHLQFSENLPAHILRKRARTLGLLPQRAA